MLFSGKGGQLVRFFPFPSPFPPPPPLGTGLAFLIFPSMDLEVRRQKRRPLIRLFAGPSAADHPGFTFLSYFFRKKNQVFLWSRAVIFFATLLF